MIPQLQRLTRPPVAGLAPHERDYLAYEDTAIARALQARARELRAAAHPGLEVVIAELDAIAYTLAARAHAYRHPEGPPYVD
ncbi:hypothetical protein [Prauserella rugosa]|uniref:Uncharacterized protein n=1 Tax=Prauserella rugosa TaxID=43354 RepID=A0A660C495_9PSEU|nr:hypothetical protein [Prauserella rugosa]KMS92669.1 hypothetical protein ACZ91_03110 [Streptomyces regensis]TWH15992.1 hypothetical protein JD82_04980 [Prauserella rugosa]